MANGKLYLVPTPIGNLQDMTLRSLEVLKNVDIIAAEDTRQTLKLLNHFEIKKSLMSYHKHNEMSKGEDIIAKLKSGINVAIVTDAGTPGISDPGAVIVKKCIEEDIEFEVLPGATAFTTALVYSGLDTTRFEFRGFISRDTKQRRESLEQKKQSTNTIIIYESPYRVKSTLDMLLQELGDRRIALCRELTKLHEEIIRGNISEVIADIKDRNIKGEFVIVIEGKTQEQIDKENKEKWIDIDVKQHLINLIEGGLTKKEAIKVVSKERGLSKNEVYKVAIDI